MNTYEVKSAEMKKVSADFFDGQSFVRILLYNRIGP